MKDTDIWFWFLTWIKGLHLLGEGYSGTDEGIDKILFPVFFSTCTHHGLVEESAWAFDWRCDIAVIKKQWFRKVVECSIRLTSIDWLNYPWYFKLEVPWASSKMIPSPPLRKKSQLKYFFWYKKWYILSLSMFYQWQLFSLFSKLLMLIWVHISISIL